MKEFTNKYCKDCNLNVSSEKKKCSYCGSINFGNKEIKLTKKDIKLKDKLKEKLKDKLKKKAFKRNQSNKTIVKSMRFTNKQLKKIETQMKKTNRSFTNYIIWRLFK